MVQILITAGLFFLIIVSLFLILVVLMQRANSDGGLGTAFGSTITESAFGTEAGNVMTKITRITFIVFFAVAFVLYLTILAEQNHKNAPQKSLFESETAAEVQTDKVPAKQEAVPDAYKVHPDQPVAPAPATPAK
jgi:preprotein translocase subunit SecG